MINLVVTHGRDQAFEVPETEARAWQDALRFGLQRVEAPYHATIPFSFAFYGDLWRQDTPADTGERGLEEVPDDTRTLEIELARELATTAGLSLPEPDSEGEKDLWDALSATVALVGDHFGLGEAFLRRFLSDVAQYLSQNDLRAKVLDRVEQAIRATGTDVVLIGHSMGSIVGYDFVSRRPELPVKALVTFGSPIGMATCRRHVANAAGQSLFPPKLLRWINIYNRQDVATLIRLLAPLFLSGDGRSVEDREMVGRPPSLTNPITGHDPIVYLSSWAMGESIRAVVDDWLASHPGSA